MGKIKAFKCIRPNVEVVSKVAALPYDVYNTKEAREVVNKEPLSFLKIDRAETQFDETVDIYDECVYKKAKEMLDAMIADGTFVTDTDDSYFLYELTMDGRSQTGLVACASVDDYLNNKIKKHEKTRAQKEADRIRHVDTCSAQTGPIFLAYRAQKKIDEIVESVKKEEALYDFVSDDNVRHKAWRISDETIIKEITSEFGKIEDVYIADGHHRAASAVKVSEKRRAENPDYTGNEEFNYFLSVLFPDNQLQILPYNRVVKDTNNMSFEELIIKIKEAGFEVVKVNEPFQPIEKATFGMFLENSWYELKANESLLSDDAVQGLDVSILQNNILAPLLGVEDPRTDERIDFVGGIRGLKELETRCNEDMKVAFSRYPTSMNELFEVADADMLMPPKSTWFEPKLRSGIFIHQI